MATDKSVQASSSLEFQQAAELFVLNDSLASETITLGVMDFEIF